MKEDCRYVAKWGLTEGGSELWGEVWNKVEEGMWTSIGFSDDRFMVSYFLGENILHLNSIIPPKKTF